MKLTFRKTLAVLLAAVFTLMIGAGAFPALLPRAFAETVTGQCGDNLTYTWDESSGDLTISGQGEMWDNTRVSFGDDDHLVRKLVIENGVTNVGRYLFYCAGGLSSITFPNDGNFTVIEYGAFMGCGSLHSLTLPQGLTTIGGGAFADAYQMDRLTIPKSVTTISMMAFKGLRSLQTLNYTGSEADWNKITISSDAFQDTPLNAPTCYYYGVEGAMNAIDDIGTVTLTAVCKERVETARAAYNALSDNDRALVTNHNALTDAESAYAKLEARTDTG